MVLLGESEHFKCWTFWCTPQGLRDKCEVLSEEHNFWSKDTRVETEVCSSLKFLPDFNLMYRVEVVKIYLSLETFNCSISGSTHSILWNLYIVCKDWKLIHMNYSYLHPKTNIESNMSGEDPPECSGIFVRHLSYRLRSFFCLLQFSYFLF